MIATEVLGELEIFDTLSEDELQRVAALMSEETFAEGDFVFREGQEGDCLYVLLEGSVDIVQQVTGNVERVLLSFGAGAVIGEMVLVDSGLRSASARCQEETRTLRLVRRDFFELAADDSALGIKVFLNLAIMLTERLRQSNTRTRSALQSQFAVSEAKALTFARLIEEQTEVEIELVSGTRLRGAILKLDNNGPAGPALTVARADGTLHLVACNALAAIHTFVALTLPENLEAVEA